MNDIKLFMPRRFTIACLGWLLMFSTAAEILDTEASGQETAAEKKRSAPQSLAIVLEDALQAFAEGEYDSAAKMVKELNARSPDNVRFQFLQGELAFAQGNMGESVAAFDEVVRLQPGMEPRLWQRGLALYYADRFKDGVKQFETHQTVNSQDVENAVWHLMCAARISDVEEARKTLIPIELDRRVPMPQIYELFAGRMQPEEVIKVAETPTARVGADSEGYRVQQYYAYLYTGLYYEMMGESEKSLQSIKNSIEYAPTTKSQFMANVSRVHVKLRAEGSTAEDPNDEETTDEEK